MMELALRANGLLVIFLAICRLVRGSECNKTAGVTGASDVNICENGTRIVQVAFLSASSEDLGEGTSCSCTMVALSPSANGSLFRLNESPRVSNCSAVISVLGSSRLHYPCHFEGGDISQQMNSHNVTINVLRNGSADFGFCLSMSNYDIPGNDFNLTCENDAPLQSHTPSPSTPSGPTVSSGVSSTVKTNASSVETTTTASPSESGVPFKGSTLVSLSSTAETSTEPPRVFPVIPVAAGVTGTLVILLVITMVVIIVILVRRRRRTKRRAPSRMSKVPVPPDIPLEDNILYEHSSAMTAGEAPKTGGATQPGEGGAGVTSGQARGHLGRGQYLGPAGDVYSLVQKAGEDGGSGHLQSAQLRSTPGLATPAVQGEEEEDTDAEHGRAADHGLPTENGLSSESLQSSSPAPGVDQVEVALDQHGGSLLRPSAGSNSATKYAIVNREDIDEMMTAL